MPAPPLPGIGASAASPHAQSDSSFKTESFSVELPARVPVWPSISPVHRRQLSADEWEALRPTIERLYIDENKTFDQVAKILSDEHQFNPTKRQFDFNVKKWGLKKNSKRNERQAIIGNIKSPISSDQGSVDSINLNLGKLKRWETESKGRVNKSRVLPTADESVSPPSDHYTDPRIKRRLLNPASETVEAISSPSTGTVTPSTLGTITPNANINVFPAAPPQIPPAATSPTSFDVVPIAHAAKEPPAYPISPPSGPESHTQSVEPLNENEAFWNAANITSSPTLTGLFAAIKIDEELPPLPPPRLIAPLPKDYISSNDFTNLYQPNQQDDCLEECSSITLYQPSSHHQHEEYATSIFSTNRNYPFQKKAKRKPPNTPDTYFLTWLNSAIESFALTTRIDPFPSISQNIKPSIYPDPSQSGLPIILQLRESEKRLHKLVTLFPEHNPGIISETQRLAHLSYEAGKFKQAESLFLRLALSKQKVLGNEHPDTVGVYLDMIEAKMDGGELLEANRLHQSIHSRVIEVFGASSEIAIRSLLLMANIRYYLPLNEETGEDLQRQALQIALSALGTHHPKVPAAMTDLATYIMGLHPGKRDLLPACEQLLRHAMSISRSLFPSEKAELYKLQKLAKVFQGYAKYDESIRVNREVIQRSRKLYGSEHPSVLMSLRGLAKSLRCKGELEQSEAAGRLCVLLTINSPGWNMEDTIRHADTIEALTELAMTLESMERWEEASRRFEEAYRHFANKYKEENEKKSGLRERLEWCYRMQGLFGGREEVDRRLEWVKENGVITTFHTEKGARSWDCYRCDLEEIEEQPNGGKRMCLSLE